VVLSVGDEPKVEVSGVGTLEVVVGISVNGEKDAEFIRLTLHKQEMVTKGACGGACNCVVKSRRACQWGIPRTNLTIWAAPNYSIGSEHTIIVWLAACPVCITY